MTTDEAREILLSNPDATEGSHHGHPDFRVGKTIFATLWPDKDRSVLRLPLELAESLEFEKPDIYKVVSKPARFGWLNVDLPKANIDEFKELAGIARESLGVAKAQKK